MRAVQFGVDSLALSVDEVWLAGFSGGASLALYNAMQTKNKITGLFLVSPCFKLRNPYAPFAPLLAKLSRYTHIPMWMEGFDHDTYAKYAAYPMNLAAQAHRLATAVRKLLTQRTYDRPLWMMLSADDETLDSDLARKLFLQQPNAANRLLWYSREAHPVIEPRIVNRSSCFPAENILDFSHTCLHISPDNPIYGRHSERLGPLLTPKTKPTGSATIYRGALSPENRARYLIRRTSYNPDFAYMTAEMDDFIDKNIGM